MLQRNNSLNIQGANPGFFIIAGTGMVLLHREQVIGS
jgi:hypothetical protein